jgi:DnaJ-domain-containing protein 1
MSERPFLRHTIAQLEELFVNSPTEETLKSLEEELRNRQVPRAVSLMAKIRASVAGSDSPNTFVLQPAFSQPVLFTAPSAETPKAKVPPPIQTPPRPVVPEQIETMILEEAYKTLRVTASTSWPEIEEARRQLVQKAHPDNLAELSTEKRTAIQTYAKLANVAFAVLHKSKIA